MRILITGGAGFIGSHLADCLIEDGYDVRILDDLVPQVHADRARPSYLHARAELIRGDVRRPHEIGPALDGSDVVVHFAARVGVGQSMYEMAEYTSANALGTAVLLEQVVARRIRRLVVASSMSVYGEGRYATDTGEIVDDACRTAEQLRRGQWEPASSDGRPLRPVATPETKSPSLASVYALSKYDQERLALLVGKAYDIPTVALRFFNVYGTRQALSNPYTGVLAIFAARLLNRRAPLVFEDGQQKRDFVSVHDVVRACRLAIERPPAQVAGRVFNVGSGVPRSIVEVATMLSRAIGVDIPPQITQQSRTGDIRHCFADLTQARRGLGYTPQVSLEDGLTELADWLAGEKPEDLVAAAHLELERRGLTA